MPRGYTSSASHHSHDTEPHSQAYEVAFQHAVAVSTPFSESLTSSNLAEYTQATSQSVSGPGIVGDPDHERLEALKATLMQLGVELGVDLPEHVAIEMAKDYNGVTPLRRFLAEKGYWYPGHTTSSNSTGQVS